MAQSQTPITERENPITRAIDVASAHDMLCLLRQSDEQIFSGYDTFEALTDASTMAVMQRAAQVARELLADPANSTIIMGGSGTSGRIAFMVARSFNQALVSNGQPPCFQYLCAGGDPALFQAKEAPEDDVKRGVAMLERAIEGKTRVLYIGITCGLSAPVVAAQLHRCMKTPDVTQCVLLGFNPPALARRHLVEGWDRSVFDVVAEMQQNGCLIITPSVGPEPITGSTRMKGASATKIILEIIFTLAFAPQPPSIPQLVEEYSRAIADTYYASQQLSSLIEAAGRALNTSTGRVFYLGEETFGIAALVDASECPPTFNARASDVRAFLRGGFGTLRLCKLS